MNILKNLFGLAGQPAEAPEPSRVIPFKNTSSSGSRANAGLGNLVRPIPGQLKSAYKWLEKKGMQQLSNKRLRVTETVSLGEKRTVSILKIDGMEILVGSASGQISLLAVLDQQQGAWRKELTPVEQTS